MASWVLPLATLCWHLGQPGLRGRLEAPLGGDEPGDAGPDGEDGGAPDDYGIAVFLNEGDDAPHCAYESVVRDLVVAMDPGRRGVLGHVWLPVSATVEFGPEATQGGVRRQRRQRGWRGSWNSPSRVAKTGRRGRRP